jgi:hypothetical protein
MEGKREREKGEGKRKKLQPSESVSLQPESSQRPAARKQAYANSLTRLNADG